MIYNIKVNENKTIEADEMVVNYSENEVDTLQFEFFTDEMSFVAEFKSPLKKKVSLPILDNKLLITNVITSLPGRWELLVVGKNGDTIFVSNSIPFTVGDNFLDYKEQGEMDANLENLYLELEEAMKQLESIDLDEIGNMGEDLDTIKNDVANAIRLSSQILEIVNYNKTTLNTVNSKVDGNLTISNTINTKLGNYDGNNPPAEGTIWHNTYWGLKRAEGANYNAELAYQNTNTILSLLTDANVIATAILEELE